MSAASFRNLGAAVRERDRRTALSLDSPGTAGAAQAGYLMPEWDALYGSLREGADAQGKGYALAGGGMPAQDTSTTRPGDEDIARTLQINSYLGKLTDQQRMQAEAQKQMEAQTSLAKTAAATAAADAAQRDQMDRALTPVGAPTTVTRTPGENGLDTITASSAPQTSREAMLASVPGHLRPQLEAQLAASDAKAATLKLQQDALAQKTQAAKDKATAAASPDDDVVQAVGAMKDGTVPPQLPGRASKDYTKILAEARRQGYDLASAATDWTATQKHIASLNGAQQLRLNQSVNALPDMLDSVDSLATKWKGGKFPLLNKANLALAKGGAFGTDAASIANQLDAQIADVTADLGNVYMGGNSPTDHALELAGKSLKADWDEKVLHDMVTMAKKNVQIRQNSIRNTGVAGASAGNPYAGGPPAAAPGGTIRARDPQGNVHEAKAGTPLPAGWKLEGG